MKISQRRRQRIAKRRRRSLERSGGLPGDAKKPEAENLRGLGSVAARWTDSSLSDLRTLRKAIIAGWDVEPEIRGELVVAMVAITGDPSKRTRLHLSTVRCIIAMDLANLREWERMIEISSREMRETATPEPHQEASKLE